MNEKSEVKTELQLHLETMFQEMLPTNDAPEDIKKDVFNTIDTLNLVGDFVDLFTTKFTQTETEFLDLLSDDED